MPLIAPSLVSNFSPEGNAGLMLQSLTAPPLVLGVNVRAAMPVVNVKARDP
jgi:hypothetical protein